MKRTLCALLALAVLLTAALTGCAGGNAQTDAANNTAQTTTDAASTDLSGTTEFVAAVTKLADSLDPLTTAQGIDATSRNSLYDSLLQHDENGNIVGKLAESYEMNDDGTKYTFHLRDDIKFSNGDPITAEDAAWSIQMMADSPYRGWLYAGIYDHCEVIDDTTLEVYFSKPAVYFLEYFAVPNGAPILCKSFYESCNGEYGTSIDKLVSSGPYVVSEWDPSSHISYTAREDYYGEQPDLKNVKLVAITDINAVSIALQTGECHMYLDDLPGASYSTIQNVSNVTITDCSSLIAYYVFFNCESGMFTDVRMRQAVAYACNRDDMVAAGSAGHGYVPQYLGDRGEGNELQGDPKLGNVWPYNLDLDKAKELVKEAGYEGASVVIKTYGTDPYPALATVLQAQLSSIGLNATVTQLERATLSSEVMDNRDYEIMICRTSGVGNEMDEYIYGTLQSEFTGSSGNWSGYRTRAAELDPLLEESRASADPAKRAEVYKQIMDIYFEDLPYITLYFQEGSRAHNSGLTIAPALAPDNTFAPYHFTK